MAKRPAPAVEPKDGLVEETKARLVDARRQKSEVEADLREGYFLTRPRLSRQILSTVAPQGPPKDADALATGLGGEVVEDFATEVINAFMPPHAPWASSAAGEGVPDDIWEQVQEAAEESDKAVFRAVRASNFDPELARALIPDAALGTVGMWIDDYEAHEPIRCQHVPLRELEINVGPYGDVDDRFVVRHCRARKVQALLPGKMLPEKVARKAKGKPDDWCEVVWGYWRDWSVAADEVWTWVCMADGEMVDSGDHRGEGSCPLIVGRFSPDSLYAFGNGPTLDSLPHLRIIDALATATQDRADVAVSPPVAYPDDGVLSFDKGIEAGKAYPKRPGSRGEIEPLYFTGDPDLGFYTLADLEKSVRRKHFADYPEQKGDTPPTATQWLDEMVKAQRRIGTPGMAFWREFPAQVFLRFRYLQAKRGRIAPLMLDGRLISTRPVNPATKAQENQEVQVATQLLGLAKSYFPLTANAAIDELKTIENIKKKMGDSVVVLRPEQQVTALVQQILGQAGEAMQQPDGAA